MTSAVPTTSTTVSGNNNISLSLGEFAYIGQGITVSSTDSNAIRAYGNNIIELYGSAIGEFGLSAYNGDTDVQIGSTGLAWGNEIGINVGQSEAMAGADQADQIINAGKIVGGYYGIYLD